MKSGSDINYKRATGNIARSNGSNMQQIQIAPKKAGDLQGLNDEEFWYGDKKDKRFGRFLSDDKTSHQFLLI